MKKEFVSNVFIAGVKVPCISTNALHFRDEDLEYITRIYQLNCEYVTVYDYVLWRFTNTCGTPGPMPSFKIEYCESCSTIKVVFTSSVLCFNDFSNLFDTELGIRGNIPCITAKEGNIAVSIVLE